MRTTSRSVGDVACLITYDLGKAPLHVSLTHSDSREPSFGALAYAIPVAGAGAGNAADNVHATTLVSSESYNESAHQVAKALALRLQRPVFVNMSTVGNMGLYAGVAEVVSELFEPAPEDAPAAAQHGIAAQT